MDAWRWMECFLAGIGFTLVSLLVILYATRSVICV